MNETIYQWFYEIKKGIRPKDKFQNIKNFSNLIFETSSARREGISGQSHGINLETAKAVARLKLYPKTALRLWINSWRPRPEIPDRRAAVNHHPPTNQITLDDPSHLNN
ncbi:hypothetical protein [Companilactobacillus mishanensis]|uniref:Uncharacterized protein n=1 Tax=Companilactobacillus mishanensis TaxID=2486008 RepID=A0ABW9P854_9LACO|nr:hypothetical protein [Companilactobacillus mishanensis]MQS45279.1 hypothetical protein [Companilactobacillus mishanensis]